MGSNYWDVWRLTQCEKGSENLISRLHVASAYTLIRGGEFEFVDAWIKLHSRRRKVSVQRVARVRESESRGKMFYGSSFTYPQHRWYLHSAWQTTRGTPCTGLHYTKLRLVIERRAITPHERGESKANRMDIMENQWPVHSCHIVTDSFFLLIKNFFFIKHFLSFPYQSCFKAYV